jgi:hypothetical protein
MLKKSNCKWNFILRPKKILTLSQISTKDQSFKNILTLSQSLKKDS